jgi:hypothetical protein
LCKKQSSITNLQLYEHTHTMWKDFPSCSLHFIFLSMFLWIFTYDRISMQYLSLTRKSLASNGYLESSFLSR